ncbi:FlxA-like family protein [Clostridium neuense]|uniref:FlxA-like family protein n=1 Tax=Clostridium neuense TaxID=1728934 RepID=A0ABW8TN24_9CLOT
MSISISNVTHGNYIPTKNKSSDDTDNQIKSLQSQEDGLKKQISEIRSGKTGSADIQQQIKPLQEQIEQIEAQIQELQVSKSTDKTDDNNVNDNSKINGNNENSANEDSVLMYGSVYNEISKVGSLGKHLKGESAVLKSDADVDDSLGDYKGAARKRKLAAGDEARTNSITRKVAKLEKKAIDLGDKINKEQDKGDTDGYTAEGKAVKDDSDNGKTIDGFA